MDSQALEVFKLLYLKDIAKGVKCESCGRELPTHADAINFMVCIQIGVPGHPALPPFQCPEVEHWACSIECWSKVVDMCKNNHIIPIMEAGLKRVNGYPDTSNALKLLNTGGRVRVKEVKQEDSDGKGETQ